jgi:hypothetical protein
MIALPSSVRQWGAVPVPWVASWSEEAASPQYVARCRFAEGRPAVCEVDRIGHGKPMFARPHMVRQRIAIVECRCDLCGKRLGIADTKVSLSFERATEVGFLCTEPLSHRACAAIAAQHCPHLKRHIATGTVRIRQVTKHSAALSTLTAAAVAEFTGETWAEGAVIGHAKVRVDRFIARSLEWLIR